MDRPIVPRLSLEIKELFGQNTSQAASYATSSKPIPVYPSASVDEGMERSPNAPLRFFYQNSQSVVKQLDKLKQWQTARIWDVIFITETWLRNDISDNSIVTDDYSLFRRDRGSHGGGLVIIYHNNIKLQLVKIHRKMEMITIVIQQKYCNYCFSLVYLPPPVTPKTISSLKRELDPIEKDLQELDKLYLIGDFNLPEVEGNYLNCYTTRGVSFFNLLSLFNLEQQLGFPTRKRNYLDLLCTCDKVTCQPEIEQMESDHKAFSFSIDINQYAFDYSNILQYNFQQTNWAKCIEDISKLDTKRNWAKDVDKYASRLITSLWSIALKHTPFEEPRNSTLPPWFDAELTEVLLDKEQLSKVCREDQHYLNSFKDKRALFKDFERIKTQRFYDEVENSLRLSATCEKAFWDHIRIYQQSHIIPKNLVYNDTNITTSERAEKFNEFFGRRKNALNHDISLDFNGPVFLDPFSLDFTENDVIKSIRKLERSFHHDTPTHNLPTVFFQKLKYSVAPILCKLYNASICSKTFPSDLKAMTVYPIHKQGLAHKIEHYSPVCHTTNIVKILDNVIADKIMVHSQPIISVSQHGFTPKRSSQTNLLEFWDYVTVGVENRAQTDVVYVVFNKDSVPHNLLLRKLRLIGFSENTINWLTSYLSNRQQMVCLGNEYSQSMTVTFNVFEVSVVGPLLFLLYINDLPNYLITHSPLTKCLLFKDNMKLFLQITNNDDCRILNEALTHLSTWCTSWGISINVGKTRISTYTLKRNPILFDYTCLESILTRTTKIIDLGVIFSTSCSFKDHVISITRKANRIVGLIKIISKRFKSADVFITLYKTLVLPIIDECSCAWSGEDGRYRKVDLNRTLKRVQENFIELLVTRMQMEYHSRDYIQLLKLFHLQKLTDRRNLMDQEFLYDLIHGEIDSEYLKGTIDSYVPQNNVATNKLFTKPSCRTKIRSNSFCVRAIMKANQSEHDIFTCTRAEWLGDVQNSSQPSSFT